MYKVKARRSLDVMTYIEGNDVYNALFLLLTDRSPKETLNLGNLSLQRLDLVSRKVYPTDNTAFSGLLGIINRLDMDNLPNRNVINYIERDELSKIINEAS